MNGKKSLSVRPATADDVIAIYKRSTLVTARAWVADLDGKPVGIAGYHIAAGYLEVFSTVTDPLRDFPVSIMRYGRWFMDELRRRGVPAVCSADEGEANSCAFLERLGWVEVGTSDSGLIYTWAPER